MLNKVTFSLSITALLVFLNGMLLAHWEIIPSMAGMAMYALGGLLGLGAVGCAIAVMFTTQNWVAAIVGMLGALPVIAIMGSTAEVFLYPRINDITTRTDPAPAFVNARSIPANHGRDMTFPAEFGPIIAEAYPDLEPLILDVDPETAYIRAHAAAEGRMPGWEITYEDKENGRFEGVATTRLFHWRDDFIIEVSATADGKSRIDMRSKSREGQSDLGANARRIRQFFDALQGGGHGG